MSSILALIITWILAFYIIKLQLYLYKNDKATWEEITLSKIFFIKREDYPLMPFNHKIFKFILIKNDLKDPNIFSQVRKIKILGLITIISWLMVFSMNKGVAVGM
jgi:hypothetical protein